MTVPIIIKLKTENNGKILNATREEKQTTTKEPTF